MVNRHPLAWLACVGICLLTLSLSGVLPTLAASSPEALTTIGETDSHGAIPLPDGDLAARRAHFGMPVAHTPFLSSVHGRHLTTPGTLLRSQGAGLQPGHLVSRRQLDTASAFLFAANPARVSFVYRC